MNDSIEMIDFEKPKLPSALNVLTILSIIGCILQFVGAVFTFYTAKTSYDNRHETIAAMTSEDVPAVFKNMMGDPNEMLEMITKSYESRIPILILSLVAVGLCFYGVLQMRKLKKQGFMLYVIGELLPFVIMAVFIGTMAMSGLQFGISVFIALLFILLYALQRKHLIY